VLFFGSTDAWVDSASSCDGYFGYIGTSTYPINIIKVTKSGLVQHVVEEIIKSRSGLLRIRLMYYLFTWLYNTTIIVKCSIDNLNTYPGTYLSMIFVFHTDGFNYEFPGTDDVALSI